MWVVSEQPPPPHTISTPPVAPFRNGKFPSSPSLPLGCLEDRDPTLLGSLVYHNVRSGMRVSYSDALRVPVPPSAKLNLLPPFLCSPSGASFQAAPQTQPVWAPGSRPGEAFGNRRSPKPSAIALLLSTHPLLRGWRRVGGRKRAVSTLHPRYRNLTVSFVLNSAVTPVDRRRAEVVLEPRGLSSLCDHIKLDVISLSRGKKKKLESNL